jgi:CO/xanthine dehydrogenase Mo-binding subunit
MSDLAPLNILGRSENHDPHGWHIVTGKADFAGDRLPGVKLYGALLTATIAHGKMLSGTELMFGQALYHGDIYDEKTGAVISTSYVDARFPTTLDFDTENMHVQDIESDDAAGPYGAHGIGEPCVSNYSAILCAIFNATGAWVDTDKGACTPDKVLKALGKA